MVIAIYARSASEDEVSRQVESCRRYVVEKWKSKPPSLKLYTEIAIYKRIGGRKIHYATCPSPRDQ